MPVNSKASIFLGGICAIGTLYVLFGNVHQLSDVTVNHIYITLTLIVALGAGHFMRDAGLVRGSGFFILFVVATCICVALSGGRSAAKLQANIDELRDEQDQRTRMASRLREAETEQDKAKVEYERAAKSYNDAMSVMQAECNGGKGTRCDGKRASMDAAKTPMDDAKSTYEDAKRSRDEIKTAIDKLKAVPLANPELRMVAKLYAHVFSTNEESALKTIMLVLPYLFSLITEFGTIMFLSHGFTHRRPQVGDDARANAAVVATEPLVTLVDIARSMNIEPRNARKAARLAGIQKPPMGWSFPASQVDAIKSQLSAHH